MDWKEYKKSWGWKKRLKIWLMVRVQHYGYPFYRYIHCSHSASAGAVGGTLVCLHCHREVADEDEMTPEDKKHYDIALKRARKLMKESSGTNNR